MTTTAKRPRLSGLPIVIHVDPERQLYWVPVSPELLSQLESEWSEPVQVRIEKDMMIFRRPA